MLFIYICIYVFSCFVKIKDGKIFVMLLFVGDDGNLYVDVYVDFGFIDVFLFKLFGDFVLFELEIICYNFQWCVFINLIF